MVKVGIFIGVISIICSEGIVPAHNPPEKIKSNINNQVFSLNSPHNVLKHLDASISKSTHNVTNNHEMDDILYQISKDLVSSILLKLDMQDKISRITKEALQVSGKPKGINAIETRRILDYISRTISHNMLRTITKSAEPELHNLVYGLGQIAAEISILSALQDTTFSNILVKKQIDLTLRKKRTPQKKSYESEVSSTQQPSLYNVILNKNIRNFLPSQYGIPAPESPYSVMKSNRQKSVHVLINNFTESLEHKKPFLNKTVLDMDVNNTNLLIHTVNNSHSSKFVNLNNSPSIINDTMYMGQSVYRDVFNPDTTDIEVEEDLIVGQTNNEKNNNSKAERLEVRAKKAILYAGDVAFLVASSVVAMRKALTASIEVNMSINLARMSNHQELLMNLAKTAAQQVGKEARYAAIKSAGCEKMLKFAIKYAAQSSGANLSHAANRIVMDIMSLPTLAKSMTYVSSQVAIDSLYQATFVKPPSRI